MEKRLGVKLGNQDIYINVAGGFSLEERAADLPVVLAVLASLYNKPLAQDLIAFGEVGLAGEVRGVTQVDKRIRESQKLGFKQIYTAPVKGLKSEHVHAVRFITDLQKLFNATTST